MLMTHGCHARIVGWGSADTPSVELTPKSRTNPWVFPWGMQAVHHPAPRMQGDCASHQGRIRVDRPIKSRVES
jgi:hypothetical protein